MPYSSAERPSIGLSLLQSALRSSGISARILYANLAFAEQIGLQTHQLLCNIGPDKLVGEWTFAAAAFPEMAHRPGNIDALAADLDPDGALGRSLGGPLAEALRRLRDYAPYFVDQMARTVLASSPKIVGCTSSFQQHCASLALLRRIRQLAPHVVTMIGGANCEGVMGQVVARSFPWVDVVVSGEADQLIVPLCRQLLDEGRRFRAEALPNGTITTGKGLSGPAPRAMIQDMDAVPAPDFDDYFLALRASPIGRWIQPILLMESSRGCWWGAQKHCTFCGLNGSGMGFRSKSPERTLQEMDFLAGRYGIQRIEMVDNILDMGYLENVLPKLRDRGAPYRLFYETKANLKRKHVELLVDSGVDSIQPGIENLNAEALKAVDKGCTPLHNLQLLKWSRETGMSLAWSILVGIPGESDGWWTETAEWLPWIEHLQPPGGVSQIHFQRYSPYHFDADKFGLDLRPKFVYANLFPLPEEDLADLAYYFEDKPGGNAVAPAGPGRRALEDRVASWVAAWTPDPTTGIRNPPRLEMNDDGEALTFIDTRSCSVAYRHRLEGLDAALYRGCDQGRSIASLVRTLNASSDGGDIDLEKVEASVERLETRRLLLRIDGKLFALATRDEPQRPSNPQPLWSQAAATAASNADSRTQP